MDGKEEGQSVDADFWHPVESILHQHRCSKFLMKSRIIWPNYDHNQKSTIKDQKSKVTTRCMLPKLTICIARIARHFMLHFTSFYVIFHVILCYISHHFMSHLIHFIVCIAHISCMSLISHFTHITHFMHCTALHVILCIISHHFIIKIYFILIHVI